MYRQSRKVQLLVPYAACIAIGCRHIPLYRLASLRIIGPNYWTRNTVPVLLKGPSERFRDRGPTFTRSTVLSGSGEFWKMQRSATRFLRRGLFLSPTFSPEWVLIKRSNFFGNWHTLVYYNLVIPTNTWCTAGVYRRLGLLFVATYYQKWVLIGNSFAVIMGLRPPSPRRRLIKDCN
jgi:hypothetical protein